MSLAEILTRKKRSSTFLNLLFREKGVANNYELSGPKGEGVRWVCSHPRPPSPTGARVHLFIDQIQILF